MRSFFRPIALAIVFLLIGSAQGLVTNLSSRLATSEKALQRHLAKCIPDSDPFPYWDHVGRVKASTGIYLGNGYVLTAAHVGPGTFELSDGSQYPMLPDSVAIFKNADQSSTELCIFRVKSERHDRLRKLPSLTVRVSPPETGDQILMIGKGASSDPRSEEWIQDGKKRWGLNVVSHYSEKPFTNTFGKTFGYFTEFGQGMFDCQGASGDSGGAAFLFDSQRREWQLAGMLTAVTTPVHLERTRHGDSTFIAALRPMKWKPERTDFALLGKNDTSYQGYLAKR